jgi:hypothetical protein
MREKPEAGEQGKWRSILTAMSPTANEPVKVEIDANTISSADNIRD